MIDILYTNLLQRRLVSKRNDQFYQISEVILQIILWPKSSAFVAWQCEEVLNIHKVSPLFPCPGRENYKQNDSECRFSLVCIPVLLLTWHVVLPQCGWHYYFIEVYFDWIKIKRMHISEFVSKMLAVILLLLLDF